MSNKVKKTQAAAAAAAAAKKTQSIGKRYETRSTRKPARSHDYVQHSPVPITKRRAVIVHSTCVDALNHVEEELPRYDKKNFSPEARFSVAICYATFLEGVLAASAPADAPVGYEMVPLLSQFGFYKLRRKQKSSSGAAATTSAPVSETSSSRVSDSDGAGAAEGGCKCTAPPLQLQKATNVIPEGLFPELQLFPRNEALKYCECCTVSATWGGGAHCCCPGDEEKEEEEEEQHDTALEDGNEVAPDAMEVNAEVEIEMEETTSSSVESNASSQEIATYVPLFLAQESSPADDEELVQRADKLCIVLARMEAAVRVAVKVASPQVKHHTF